MAIASHMVSLGTPAPDFALPALGGGIVSLTDLAGAPALLVVFLSNHCPYVKHLESALGPLAEKLAGDGLVTVAICSNDTDRYPDDGPAGLADQVARAGFTFPYLIDTTQETATAFCAACTPDFFLYDAQRRLAWRGQFDNSRPSTGGPVTGETLRAAVEHVLAGRPVPEPHAPSLGCGIKWKAGNGPS
ncbi:thioredoxin family protein [Sporichthya sp.]|uniref:thioredoxin family protein n=1 Tax=Sporichthya sp. TaxID=65475 RepID=UPI0018422CA3|nr:thioredoxin family protein [Sporichthya sp.]MBA3742747.1 thioredoxin family protein [Sporichthya sp.]